MAASSSQELRYMIVFTTEGKPQIVEATDDLKRQHQTYLQTRESADDYAQGLQRLKGGMASLSRPSQQVILSQRQLQSALKSTNKGMMQTGRNTAITNNLLIALTRGAQDAQYGMMGVANNLQQSAELASSASMQMGGMKNVVMGLASSLMNPATGLIIGVTAVTAAWQAAESGAFDFNNALENSDDLAKKYIETLDKLAQKVGGFGIDEDDIFSTKELEKRLDTTEKVATYNQLIVDNLDEQFQKQVGFLRAGNRALFNQEEYDRLAKQISLREDKISQAKELQEQLEGEITARKQLQTDETAIQLWYEGKVTDLKKDQIDYIKESNEEMKDFSRSLASDINSMQASIQDGMDPLAGLDDSGSGRAKEAMEQAKARITFQSKLETQRIQLIKEAGDQELAYRLQIQREIQQIDDNEHISKEQKEQAKYQIYEKYALLELSLAEQKAEKEKQLADAVAAHEEAVAQQKFNNQMIAVQGTIGLLGTVFEGSKKISKAIAIADGLAASIAALKNPPGPPTTIPLSLSILATSVRRANQIGNLSLNNPGYSGGGGGNGESVNPVSSFRGISAKSIEGRRESEFPRTVRLVDGAGKFLTKLQFAQDQEKSAGYMTED